MGSSPTLGARSTCGNDCNRLSGSDGVVTYQGARRWHYVEIYYFGNPPLYQWYLLGMNDAGISHADTFGLIRLLGTGDGSTGWFAETSEPFKRNANEEVELQVACHRGRSRRALAAHSIAGCE